MQETAQQYIQRILSNVEGEDAIKVQKATPGKLKKLIRGLTPKQLKWKPEPGKWSIAQIVAHLADAEIVIAWRIRSILGAPGTPIQAYDQDAWAAVGNYAKRDPRKSIEQFRAMREANLAFYKSLRPEQWKQSGMHSERGEESIDRIARMIAGHDINHILQIERILAPKK